MNYATAEIIDMFSNLSSAIAKAKMYRDDRSRMIDFYLAIYIARIIVQTLSLIYFASRYL